MTKRVYLAGPEAFIRTATIALREQRFPETQLATAIA